MTLPRTPGVTEVYEMGSREGWLATTTPNTTAHAATAAAAAATPPKTKKHKSSSLFSRLATPLASLGNLRPPRAARKLISEFYIRLNEPHKEYAPGDLVRGTVVITTEKDLRVTHLVVNLVGRVDLYGVATYTGGKGKKNLVNYTGPVEFEGGVVLCRDQQVLCGDGRLDAGIYEFGFVLELAGKGLPSSLDVGIHCTILTAPRMTDVGFVGMHSLRRGPYHIRYRQH